MMLGLTWAQSQELTTEGPRPLNSASPKLVLSDTLVTAMRKLAETGPRTEPGLEHTVPEGATQHGRLFSETSP